jgi:hypothetical protein
MSYNENNNEILNDEIIETKPKKKQYKPRDPNYNTVYYHKNVVPVECTICGCTVVNRALYNHKKTAKCKLVKHFKDLANLEYEDLKKIQQQILLEDYKL